MRTRWLSLVTALALAPAWADAQPRDHRDDKPGAPAGAKPGAPDVRDHRDDNKPGDNKPGAPDVRDHRDDNKPGDNKPGAPDVRDHRDDNKPGDNKPGAPEVRDHRDGPDGPPPPRRTETPGTRDGFTWAAGEWDWKDGKWAWTDGHWEREQSGKQWRPGRWDQRDGSWVRTPGTWADAAPPPAKPQHPAPPAKKDWKIERPVVSGYWPSKGKAGAKVVIRGRNFPNNAVVVWGGAPVEGVQATETTLTFTVPPNAASGQLAVRAGRGRDVAVGSFEVAPSFDAEAERKRQEDEARKKAEAAWTARQAQLAKDRAAREAAVAKRTDDRIASRDQRRADRVEELRGHYARDFLADEATQSELQLHAQRVAELVRMADVAEIKADKNLSVRIDVLIEREDDRHEQRMAALEAAFKSGGAR